MNPIDNANSVSVDIRTHARTDVHVDIREVSFHSVDYAATVQLRLEVLRYPLKIDFSAADLLPDRTDHHLAAFDSEGRLIGCLILAHVTTEDLKMRQVAVSADVQGRGVGQKLVAAAEAWALEHGYKTFVLSAREVAINFYLKLGYRVVGDRYTEVTIPHFKMRKVLDQPR